MFENLPETCNYIEIILVSEQNKHDDDHYISISSSFPYEWIEGLLKSLSLKNSKPSHRVFKRYRFNELTMEHDVQHDIKIHALNVLSWNIQDPHCVVLLCHKEKLAYHQFPSTNKLHDAHLVERIAYRIHNRVYLNVEKQTYENELGLYKVWLNVNMDSNIDMNGIKELVDDVLKRVRQYLKS
jgi:hypothetical protein